MNLHVPALLKPEELQKIQQLIEKSEFIDGRTTASQAAKAVKNNFQLDADHPNTQEVQQIILDAIQDSPLMHQAFLPKKVRKPLISKYGPGMSYGWHVDSPIMDESLIRTDLAMTLFLNDPNDYEGGELHLNTASGAVQYKLKPGDAIVYPALQVHGVSEVKTGYRLVAVTWIQSAIRQAGQRELLFNLSQVQALLNQKEPNAQHTILLMQCYSNLIRMWAEV